MTAVIDGVSRPARRVRAVWVALALSLTLNVFIVGGVVWSMMAAERVLGPAERFLAIGRSLDLTPEQRTALGNFGNNARKLNRTLREANSPLMLQIWTEVAKPNPDEAEIARLDDQAIANRRAFQQGMTAGLVTFLAALTPEQRSKFAAAASRPPGANGGRVFRLNLP
jgi:uncharacterized membrane protein